MGEEEGGGGKGEARSEYLDEATSHEFEEHRRMVGPKSLFRNPRQETAGSTPRRIPQGYAYQFCVRQGHQSHKHLRRTKE